MMHQTEVCPEPYSNIIGEVCKKDKQYFEWNKAAIAFIRPYSPGEFYPTPFDEPPDATYVIYISPVLRIRTPLWRKRK
jgi:hypothetical protein